MLSYLESGYMWVIDSIFPCDCPNRVGRHSPLAVCLLAQFACSLHFTSWFFHSLPFQLLRHQSFIQKEAYLDRISIHHPLREHASSQDIFTPRANQMPFFNKKPQAADANTATAVGNNNNAPATEKSGLKGLMSRRNREPAQPTQDQAAYGHDNLNRRPTFGQWLKGTIVDIITMVIMGVIGLGVCITPSNIHSNANTPTGLLRSTSSIPLIPCCLRKRQRRLPSIRLSPS